MRCPKSSIECSQISHIFVLSIKEALAKKRQNNETHRLFIPKNIINYHTLAHAHKDQHNLHNICSSNLKTSTPPKLNNKSGPKLIVHVGIDNNTRKYISISQAQ